MTCIVAIRHKDSVYMGCDSAVQIGEVHGLNVSGPNSGVYYPCPVHGTITTITKEELRLEAHWLGDRAQKLHDEATELFIYHKEMS